jgi:hypothetical protein
MSMLVWWHSNKFVNNLCILNSLNNLLHAISIILYSWFSKNYIFIKFEEIHRKKYHHLKYKFIMKRLLILNSELSANKNRENACPYQSHFFFKLPNAQSYWLGDSPLPPHSSKKMCMQHRVYQGVLIIYMIFLNGHVLLNLTIERHNYQVWAVIAQYKTCQTYYVSTTFL